MLYPNNFLLLLTAKGERIRLFVKRLNTKLQISIIQMTYSGKTFWEIVDFLKIVEDVRQDGFNKSGEKIARKVGNCSGSYSRDLSL